MVAERERHEGRIGHRIEPFAQRASDRVDAGAVLSGCVLGAGVVVGAGAHIDGLAVIGDNARIDAGVRLDADARIEVGQTVTEASVR